MDESCEGARGVVYVHFMSAALRCQQLLEEVSIAQFINQPCNARRVSRYRVPYRQFAIHAPEFPSN